MTSHTPLLQVRSLGIGHGPRRVLSEVSFSLQRGELLCLLGPNGSGKTTLLRTLLGLLPPQSGEVRLLDRPLPEWSRKALARHIGYVPQDILLFSGSVRDNLMLGSPFADDEAMLRAAELGGVMEIVARHPKGLAMQIGERGEALSGGQRQSIAIARAFIKEPPLLMLDEPTNSLDNRSEEILKARLGHYLSTRHTLILVTHRASLLALVNRLIVLDNGRIVADGEKQQVLDALSGGKIHV